MIDIQEWKEHEDGSATFTIEMDYDELVTFAKEGVMSTITNAAREIVRKHGPIPKDDPELQLALENVVLRQEADRLRQDKEGLQKEIDDLNETINDLRIYKRAILKMCSHRQNTIDDYIRIAKQAVEDEERGYHGRFPSMRDLEDDQYLD